MQKKGRARVKLPSRPERRIRQVNQKRSHQWFSLRDIWTKLEIRFRISQWNLGTGWKIAMVSLSHVCSR